MTNREGDPMPITKHSRSIAYLFKAFPGATEGVASGAAIR